MIRKRRDSEGPRRGAIGIDGHEGESFGRDYAVDPWSNYGNRKVPDTDDIKGRRVRNNAGEAAYSPDSDGASAQRGADEFQFTAGTRDIYEDTMRNDRPGGDDDTDFDTCGPIRAGVSRSQSDGEKKGGAR